MKHTSKINGLLRLLLLSAVLILAEQAEAQLTCTAIGNLCIISNGTGMFRSTVSANDVITAGDLLDFSAEIFGGSSGTTMGATYPSDSPPTFTVGQRACNPPLIDPNNCQRQTLFNSNRLQPWTLKFQKGTDVLSVCGPAVLGINNAVLGINNNDILKPAPFPHDVKISGSGTTPTITWTIPDVGFTPDGFRVNIYDKSNGDIIHSQNLANNALSYPLPQPFPDSGLSLVMGGLYAIAFQVVETKNHVPFAGNNDILRRSIPSSTSVPFLAQHHQMLP